MNQTQQSNPDRFPIKFVQNRPVICYVPDLTRPDIWKIALPAQLHDDTIRWYHETESIRQHFYIPGLRQKCDTYHCEVCQKNKLIGPGYGLLPPREAPLAPWSEVMVDLIGPWKIQVNNE